MLTFFSSGDLTADRRFQYAEDLRGRGDVEGAADLLTQALELAPRFTSAWFALGELRQEAGDRDGARAAFEHARAADPDDRLGASLRLACLGGAANAAPDTMPPAYVRTLFDQYAPRFDKALVDGLAYRGPGILKQAVLQVWDAQSRPRAFARMLDLGCGTGLAGQAFRPLVRHLVGVDLSAGMVAQARDKIVYDRLEAGDLLAFLRGEAGVAERYDLIIAADVFAYLGDLGAVCAAAAAVVEDGALFAFTVETHAGEGVILGEKLRYAHSRAHVETALTAAGLLPVLIEDASTRNDGGVPVPGLVVIAQR